MDKIIQQSIMLPCDAETAFKMFTVNEHLQGWFTAVAEVEPRVGGKYELFWNPNDRENDSTIGCKVLAVEQNKLICFEWKGARQFKQVMNEVRPLTNVSVFFLPAGENTEVHVIHTGWRDSAEWEEARSWFDKAWEMSLASLKKYAGQQVVEKCCEPESLEA